MKSPAEYEVVDSDSYPINTTYALKTGDVLNVYKKGNVCQIPMKALKPLPYGQDVTILSPIDDKYKPLAKTISIQIYDSNNSGFVDVTMRLDGSLHIYSYIRNPTGNHNLSVNNIMYIAKN